MPEPAQPSVVVDGRVSTAGLKVDPAAAAGKSPPKTQVVLDDPVSADPTKDPEWAAFQAAHADSLIPASQGLSDVERYIQEQSGGGKEGWLASEGAPKITGHPKATSGGPAGQIAQPLPAGQPQPSTGAQVVPAATTNQQTPEELEKRTNALAALKRDGWKDSMIQKLSDADLLEIGLQRHETQQAIDVKLGERRQALRETAKDASKKEPVESGATPASGSPGPTAPPTFDAAIKEAATDVSKIFAEHFGEEIGKPAGTAMESALKKFAGPLLQQNQQLLQGLEVLGGFLEEVMARDVRRDWKDDFPAVADQPTWDQIRKTYERLTSTGSYEGPDGMREAYEHARRIVLPGAQPAGVTAKRAAEEKKYADGHAALPVIGARAPATGEKSEDRELWDAFQQAHKLSASMNAAMGAGVQ
jgi:hypothetical protein